MKPNQPTAPNAALTLRLQARRLCRGVTDPERSANSHVMPVWLQVICVVAAALLLTPLMAWADSRRRVRSQRHYESWRCPQCGESFGQQREQRGWTVRRDPYIPGAPMGGPILHCSHCDADFAFDGEGRQVDDHREYVTPTA